MPTLMSSEMATATRLLTAIHVLPGPQFCQRAGIGGILQLHRQARVTLNRGLEIQLIPTQSGANISRSEPTSIRPGKLIPTPSYDFLGCARIKSVIRWLTRAMKLGRISWRWDMDSSAENWLSMLDTAKVVLAGLNINPNDSAPVGIEMKECRPAAARQIAHRPLF